MEPSRQSSNLFLWAYSTVISSLLAISKAGVEKLLVFGQENKLDVDVQLRQKITTTLKYLPVFLNLYNNSCYLISGWFIACTTPFDAGVYGAVRVKAAL